MTERELFDRCKEIFHTSFKTRKGGKEAYNPIRDGKAAFRGKAVNEGITRFVWDLESVMRDFGKTEPYATGRMPRADFCRAGNQSPQILFDKRIFSEQAIYGFGPFGFYFLGRLFVSLSLGSMTGVSWLLKRIRDVIFVLVYNRCLPQRTRPLMIMTISFHIFFGQCLLWRYWP